MQLHASVKHVKRSQGRSSVAAAAYRHALKLEDERTGLVHDYTRKSGVEHSQTLAPAHAPDWVHDPAKLWNAVERRERHVKAETAHELELAFPHEFTPKQRHEAGENISRELVRRYGCAVSIAHHLPSPDGDERNYHAHLLFTTRGFDDLTKGGWQKTKYRDLSQDTRDQDKKHYLDDNGNKTTRGRLELLELREFSAGEMNRIAKRDRVNVFVQHLSFEKQGIDREPTQHMGHKATSMERRGKKSRIGEKNREVELVNANRLKDRALESVISVQVSMQQDAMKERADEQRRTLKERLRDAQIDLHSKHRRERDQLEERQNKENSALRYAIASQLEIVNGRLENARGVKKIVRNILGHTRADQATQHELQKALQALRVSEQLQQKELRMHQQRERDQFRQFEREEGQHLEKVIEREESRPMTLKERLKDEYQRAASGEGDNHREQRIDLKNEMDRKPH